MHPSPDLNNLLSGTDRFCRRAVWVIFGITFALGFSNLLVWFVRPLQELATMPGIMIVRVNTAAAITAAAVSLLLWQVNGAKTARCGKWIAQLMALVPTVIGGLTSLEYLTGWNMGIDELLAAGTFEGDRADVAVVAAGRMSLNASLSLFLLGLGLVFLEGKVTIRKRWRVHLAAPLAASAALPAFLGLVGYLMGQGGFTGILRSTNILFHAALCLLFLSLGILLLRPFREPVASFFASGAEGVLLRWLLPGSAIVLLTLAALIGRGRAGGLVQPGEGTALMLFGGMVLLFALITAAGRAVRQQEESARLADAALQERRRFSQLMLDTALDGVVLIDAGGTVVDWNAAAERIFGWRREEMIGRPLAGLVVSESALAELGGKLQSHLSGQEEVLGKRLELSALRRDGSEFAVELVLNTLEATLAPLFVAFVRDITEQKSFERELREAKERAERASQAKDDFLAALSHELRTPLTPVLLSASTLAEDPSLPQNARDELAAIERNIALEARLIDDLLDLTRISKGKLSLRQESCLLHDLLGHAVEIVRDDAQGRRVALELVMTARRCGVMGDPARLQQVFWNLLKNAVKFTPAGGKITVRSRDGAEEGTVELEVEDTGIGFTPEAADRLFMPFEQATPSGDHQFGGLGLGLAIARAIVDLHGGKITAHSEGHGKGALFRVVLPQASVPPEPKTAPADGRGAGSVTSAPLQILLVEDHDLTRKALAHLLIRSGNQVSATGSLAEAIAAVETQTFDVVISDLGLPDGSGFDLMPQLRERSQHLTGIALSGYGMEEDLQRSSEAGFVAHLVKPIRFEQLTQVLRQVRRQRQEEPVP